MKPIDNNRPGYFPLLGFCLAMVMLLSGCALLDDLFLDPLKTEDGEALYVDVAATAALPDADKQAGKAVLVRESQLVPGKEYEKAYSDQPSALVGTIGSISKMIPGWGALSGGILSLLVGGYAGLRGRKSYKAGVAAREAGVLGMGLLAEVIADYSAGKLDEDKDGSIDLGEIGSYLKRKGLEHLNPDFVQKVINVGASGLQTSEKQKALAELAKQI